MLGSLWIGTGSADIVSSFDLCSDPIMDLVINVGEIMSNFAFYYYYDVAAGGWSGDAPRWTYAPAGATDVLVHILRQSGRRSATCEICTAIGRRNIVRFT